MAIPIAMGTDIATRGGRRSRCKTGRFGAEDRRRMETAAMSHLSRWRTCVAQLGERDTSDMTAARRGPRDQRTHRGEGENRKHGYHVGSIRPEIGSSMAPVRKVYGGRPQDHQRQHKQPEPGRQIERAAQAWD